MSIVTVDFCYRAGADMLDRSACQSRRAIRSSGFVVFESRRLGGGWGFRNRVSDEEVGERAELQ